MREEGGGQVNRAVQVVIGVDTHQDEHVAVAIDQQGVRNSANGVRRRLPGDMGTWSNGPWSLGEVGAFGVEGTGSYGAGFSRYLTGLRGYTVVEVNRP